MMESEERATEVGETDNWITSSGVILLICLYQGLGLDSSPSPQSPVLSLRESTEYILHRRYNDLLNFFQNIFLFYGI